jgi:uncharacterized integral membrane protein
MMSRTLNRRTSRSRVAGTGIWWGFLGTLGLATAVTVLIVQNDETTRFEWLWFDFTASLGVMMLLTALAAVVATTVGGLVWRHRRRTALKVFADDGGDHGAAAQVAAEPAPRSGVEEAGRRRRTGS